MPLSLPIDALRPALEDAWARHRNFLLRAPTGSGKSTRVPRFLLDWQGFPSSQSILVLQPRRLAARLLARRVADELGQPVGQTVGYQVRFERVASAQTRVLYVTEGLLLRRLSGGDGLRGVGAILFDEFHERHLEGDIGLGLALRRQAEGWSGRIGIFSATLETSGLRDYLPDTAVLESEGRQYGVETRYVRTDRGRGIWEGAVAAVRQALAEGAEADLLVFMPGKYEIHRTVEALEHLRELRGWDVLGLHGEMDPALQDRATGVGERPRVIVATNVAETSLTLPGVRTVVDSGLARMAEYDARRGVNTLLTERISRASAEQRAGRAGRLAPGRCYRLWSETEHSHLQEFTDPEIRRLDLSEIRLQLVRQGAVDGFPWLEPPPLPAWERAGQLLEDLGAVQEGKLTAIGEEMSRYPLHPRYSRLLLAGQERGCLPWVLAAIAVEEGRELLLPLTDKRRAQERESWWEAVDGHSDLLRPVLVWQRLARADGDAAFCREWGIHMGALRQAARVYAQLERLVEGRASGTAADAGLDLQAFGKCMLTAYVDHLGRRLDRGTRRCELVHGRRGELSRDSTVEAPLFVAAELEEREVRGEATLMLGGITAVDPGWLDELFPGELRRTRQARLDAERRRVICMDREEFRGLVLGERESGDPDPAAAAQLLAREITRQGWVLKGWDAEAESWIRRVNVLSRYFPEWEISPITDEDRELIIGQICEGALSYKEVKDRPVLPILQSWLPDSLLPLVDSHVPVRFELPGGPRIKLRYEADGSVVLPARIQQLYDVPGKSLHICDGRCRLRVELLAPSGRPVQITEDLDGFWTGQYPQVKKDLFGRYPRHEWR